jgi:anaerobic magnesium-protoporphyrin IX monomethyl ester cyclase
MTKTPHKILLLRPPEPRGAAFAQFYTLHEALGIGYLASFLRSQGCMVEILDAHIEGLDNDKTIECLGSKEIDILGISIISPLVLPQACQIAAAMRSLKKDIHITMGGQHPTFFYESILGKHPAIDTIVRFEGEMTFLELIEKNTRQAEWDTIEGIAFRKNGKIVATPPRALIADLDTLPFPARDTLSKLLEKGGLPLLLTGRGCPNDCSFCSVHAFYSIPRGKLCRQRSPENVVSEIRHLVNNFGCDEIWFVDENFFGPGKAGRKRVRQIFQGMEKGGLRLGRIDFSCRADSIAGDPELMELAVRQGAKLIYVGVEAGLQRILDLYNKRTTVEQNKVALKIVRDSGAKNKMEFIFFNPWITFDEVKETLSFLEEVKEYDPYILTSILTIMRNTPLGGLIDAGKIEIITPLPDQLTDFDQDAFIPYRITDARVRMVYEIVSMALMQFETVLYALSRMSHLIRLNHAVLAPEVIAANNEWLDDYAQLINETSLDIFKEAVTAVEKIQAVNEPDSYKRVRQELTQRTLQFTAFLAGVIDMQEKELLNGIHEPA